MELRRSRHGERPLLYEGAMLAIAFVALFLPETKGITTLAEMEFKLKNGVRLRDLGNRPATQKPHAEVGAAQE